MQPRPRTASLLLKYLSGPHQGQMCLIEAPGGTLGRESTNDIVIEDATVSPCHARVQWSEGGWRIEQVTETGVLTVDGTRVRRATIVRDSTIGLGERVALVVLFAADERAAHQSPNQAPDDAPSTHTDPANRAEVARHFGAESIEGRRSPSSYATQTSAFHPVTASTPEGGHADATQVAPLEASGLPWIEVTSTTHGLKRSYLLDSQVVNVGRDASNDIVIDDPIISSQHLQIVRRGRSYVLNHPHPERASTLYGLLHRGRTIRGNEHFSKVLSAGDFFRIGNEHGSLITLTYHDGMDRSGAMAPAMQPIKLVQDTLTIGRQPDNDVVLAHPQVSGHHARLVREGAGHRIVDLRSKNHVYVNAEAITSRLLETGDEIRIGPYRFVFEGNRLAQYDESNFIRIDALNLRRYGSNHVTLLDNISLTIPPRAFVAVVGGSGAGKSTLMNALNGMHPADQGSVFYNGRDYYRAAGAFSTQIGYVPQDDIVHLDLTVERALFYAAKLRLPNDYSEEQVEQRIKEVLEEVELTSRRTLMIKRLSGGQRKRVSIALELLANPSVFFLDEPTSGLDPGLDRKMMFLLRKLADRGHTVVLITHATTNINSCDYVCFLCSGGRMAYFGPPEQARQYFGKTDFAEIYSVLEPTEDDPDIPARAEACFVASPEYEQYLGHPLSARMASLGAAANGAHSALSEAPPRPRVRRRNAWSQFLMLSLRYLESLKNDSVNLLILLLQAPVIAILLVLMLRFELGAGIFNRDTLVQCRTQILAPSGPIALPDAQHAVVTSCQHVVSFLRFAAAGQGYAQQHGGVLQALQDFIIPGPGIDAQKALFNLAFATIVFGCLNGAREFVKETAIFQRERAVNLGIVPYMFSKIVVLGLLCLVQSAVLTLVVQIGEPFQQGIFLSPVLETYVTLVLTALAGLMIGLAISAIAPNADRALSFIPIILIPQVIFSGAIIPLKDWLTQIVATIFPVRWSMAALGSSMGLHADAVGGDRLFGSDPTYHGTLYSIYTQTDALHRLLLSWSALAATITLLCIVIGVVLKRKDSQA